MEMTTPVFTRREKSQGEKMDMTTPVITRRVRLSSYLFILLLVDHHHLLSTENTPYSCKINIPVTFDFVILCLNSIFQYAFIS